MDFFTPPKLREDLDATHRAHLIAGLAILGSAFGCLYVAFYLAIGHLWGALVISVCDVAMIAAPFWIRAKGNLTAAANLQCLTWTIGFSALAAIEGGVHGHAIAWLACGVPLLALLILERGAAMIWCAVCFFVTLFYCALDAGGVRLHAVYPERWHSQVTAAGYVGFAVFMSLLGLFFEQSRRHSFNKIEDVLRDLSRATERSRTSEHFIQRIADATPGMLYMLDLANQTIIYANRRLTQALGLPAGTHQKIDVEHVKRFMSEADFDRALNSLRERLRNTREGDFIETEYEFEQNGPRWHWICRDTVFSRGPNGEPKCILGLAENVTEFKQLQQQFLKSQKMEAIGRLAGGIAHDFNNLLTAILGYNEIVRRDLDSDQRLQRYTSEITKAGERAAKLTHQLLAFSRKQTLQPRVIDLNAIVGDIKNMLNRLIGEHIDLITSFSPDLECVQADPGQIEQVIVNLVVNARDAMPDGGRITIQTRNIVVDGSQERHGVFPGRYASLRVSDTGTGMGKDVLNHIFEPFFTTKPEGKGTGLGLATCYGIIQQSGGHISVSSQPGKGTTFEILLPAVQQTADSPAAPARRVTLPKGDETVLVVEDRAELRALAVGTLRQQGYNVIEAENGERALQLARDGHDIDLLLTDVIMPQMNGKELAERFHKLHPGKPVLFSSGSEMDTRIGRALHEGWAKFLPKPFTPEGLAYKVREVLDEPLPGVN